MTVDTVTNDEANFFKLVAGRVDCVLALELTGNLFLHQKGFQDQVVALETPVAVNDTYLVFAKRAQKTDLLDQFNTTLKVIKEDGTYEQVIQDYLKQLE